MSRKDKKGETKLRGVREITDKELGDQLKNAREKLNSIDYGTEDYNSALAEFEVAKYEKLRRERLRIRNLTDKEVKIVVIDQEKDYSTINKDPGIQLNDGKINPFEISGI